MSTATGTRIFGIKVTLDPKIIIGGLVVLAGILFWYNSGSDDPATPAARPFNPDTVATAPVSSARPTIVQRRAGAPVNDHGTLRLRPIDGTKGDVDPTLRLDLLRRLSTVQPAPATRSLFEVGSAAPTATAAANLPPIKAPVIKPTTPILGPGSVGYAGSVNTAINIPLKYYGFVKPSTPQATNSGLFLEGENVLVAKEGERVKGYLVVELTPNSARLEDTNLKQGQTLPVVPVAAP